MRQEWVDRCYSGVQLKYKRRNFLRSCRYAVFRQLVRSGEIDQHLETKADEGRQHTESVVAQGTFTNRRGRGAARVHLLDETCARGQGLMADVPPQGISPDTGTAVERQHRGPAAAKDVGHRGVATQPRRKWKS